MGGAPLKILFLAAPEEDYLSDGILRGLLSNPEFDVCDYPEREVLFTDCPPESRRRIRGGGFTLYTTPIKRVPRDRFHIRQRLERREFDLVVVSDVWRVDGLVLQFDRGFDPLTTVYLDGQDSGQVFPFAGKWWRRPFGWLLPRVHSKSLYFKREWHQDTHFNAWHRILPRRLRRPGRHMNLRKVSFSIPEEKIVDVVPAKVQRFATHCVDPEVAKREPQCNTVGTFGSEAEYYADLQRARYGITTKRAGWDCLRHYEIAANGCVPCFRDLHHKPETCAPHGLVDGKNCISYQSYQHLIDRISSLGEDAYRRLAQGALSWARGSTCGRRAKEVVECWRSWVEERRSRGGRQS